MKVQRDKSCRASPETVWKRCLQDPARWSEWDEDLRGVTNVSGPCENGTTMTFEMAKDGQKYSVEISNVIRNSRATFSGSFCCGLAGFQGDIELQGGAGSCAIFYSFEMNGILGSLLGNLLKKELIEGTEKGLANMVRIAEA
jgi:hypothetical protein